MREKSEVDETPEFRQEQLNSRIAEVRASGAPYAVTVAESAVLLGVSRAYAYQLANDGTLPTVRLGRRILVPAEAIARLLTVA